MIEKIHKNVILFIVGFCLYITIETLYRGYTFVLMGVCAGFVMVVLDKINSYISWDVDILVQCLIGAGMITGLELIIGEIFLNTDLLPAMWDYSGVPLNYEGIICVPFVLIWMGLSFVAIVIADSINYYTFDEEPAPYYKLFGHKIIQFKEKTEE